MNPISPQCRRLYTTVYGIDYITHPSSKSIKAKTAVSEDPLIIDGNCANNLNINNKPLPKVLSDHPTIKPANEEYFSFIDRIEKRSPVLYNRFFKDAKIDKEYIEKEINDINKTEYQYKYSPNEFLPLSGYVRLLRRNLRKPRDWKFHDTTYRNSYSHILECGDLREVIKSSDFRIPSRCPIADELNRIYKTGRSVYQTSYSGGKAEPVACKV